MIDVRPILERVQTEGAAAVLDFTAQFDGVRLTVDQLVYDPFDIKVERPAQKDCAAIDFAIRSIRQFHQTTKPRTANITHQPGLALEETWVPLGRVGIYAPNGRYPLISSLLMTAIPAQVAGVSDLVVAISPRGDSPHNPLWNYALRQLGIHSVLAAGGAQAVAALAYGLSDRLAPVHLIAGPGNAYVAAAKQTLFAEGIVGIDLLAGPSEAMVIADADANLEYLTLDLLSQAEHSPDASSKLVSWDADVIESVQALITREIRDFPSRDSLGPIAYLGVKNPDEAVEVANQTAPEHLTLAGPEAERLAPRIRTAGALFVGSMAGQALGDYVAGPSHVLPTQGTGRFLSGLSTRTFMRKMSVIKATPELAAEYLENGAVLAEMEGLYFHRQALLRRKRKQG